MVVRGQPGSVHWDGLATVRLASRGKQPSVRSSGGSLQNRKNRSNTLLRQKLSEKHPDRRLLKKPILDYSSSATNAPSTDHWHPARAAACRIAVINIVFGFALISGSDFGMNMFFLGLPVAQLINITLLVLRIMSVWRVAGRAGVLRYIVVSVLTLLACLVVDIVLVGRYLQSMTGHAF